MTIQEMWDVTWDTFTNGLQGFWDLLGTVIGALVIVIVGLIVAALVRAAVLWVVDRIQIGRLAASVQLDRVIDTKTSWGGLLADLAQWFVIIVFLLPALAVLGVEFEGVLADFLAFVPVALLAAAVVLVGFIFADLASRAFAALAAFLGATSAMVVGVTVRYAIWVFTAVIALTTLGVSREIIDNVILAAIVATAIGGGVAFGLGGRDAAAGVLKRWGGLWPKR